MSDCLTYQDTVTFVKVTTSEYGNKKIVEQQVDVPVIFLQNTGFDHANFQDSITSDAICFPDPDHDFVIENFNRLEGMYILAPLFDVSDDDGWYKVETTEVNRDHLLENQVDNIELRLKKTRPINGVS